MLHNRHNSSGQISLLLALTMSIGVGIAVGINETTSVLQAQKSVRYLNNEEGYFASEMAVAVGYAKMQSGNRSIASDTKLNMVNSVAQESSLSASGALIRRMDNGIWYRFQPGSGATPNQYCGRLALNGVNGRELCISEPASVPPTVSLQIRTAYSSYASTALVTSGSTALLQLTSADATSCTVTGVAGSATSFSDTATGPIITNTTFTATCTGAGGTSSPVSVTATILDCNSPAAIVSNEVSSFLRNDLGSVPVARYHDLRYDGYLTDAFSNPWDWAAAGINFYADAATAKAYCNYMGYASLEQWNTASVGSCGDNAVVKWNPALKKFQVLNACGNNAFAYQMSCRGKLHQACYDNLTWLMDRRAPPQNLGNLLLAGGDRSFCGVRGGAVQCWGNGGNGELGDGNYNQSRIPVYVTGLSSGVTAISGYSNHYCAIQNGAALCWGSNNNGRLGNGNSNRSAVPVQVTGLTSGVTAIAVGQDHTCAIQNGALKCWGYNGNGRLGTGNNTEYRVPTQVVGLTSGVTAVGAGLYHTCAIHNGAAKCWGYNGYGQLGNNSTNESNIPVNVTGLSSGITTIAAGGYHSCAVGNGTAYCWGHNGEGQLGDNTNNRRLTPVAVVGMLGVPAKFSLHDSNTCVRHTSNTIACWGYNGYGQLVNGNRNNTRLPGWAMASGNFHYDMAMGRYAFCGVYDSHFQCGGTNGNHQLGTGYDPILGTTTLLQVFWNPPQ